MPTFAFIALIVLALQTPTVDAQAKPPDEGAVLYSQLVAAFHIQAVHVQLSDLSQLGDTPGHVVQVTFEDSTVFALSKPDRRKAARGVAEFIRDNFVGYKKLNTILVSWSSKSPDGAMELFAVPFNTLELGQPKAPSERQ
jgi:hypothetical protein